MVDTLVVVDAKGMIGTVNQATLDLLGYAQGELVGKPIDVILAEEEAFVGAMLQKVLATGFVRDLSLVLRAKSGERILVYFSGSAMRDATGTLMSIVVVARDMRRMNQLQAQLVQAGDVIINATNRMARIVNAEIIEHKKVEEGLRDSKKRLRASLDKKEVLLKEINHRVTNNLQIISNLLSLQSRDIEDEQALHTIQVSQDRIKAMAHVHEMLLQSDDLARIDFGEYIKSLATDLRFSYGLGLRDIDLKIDVENILLGVDTAIPCGLIVNELVANSLKHAFPGDRSGEIVISFQAVDGQNTMIFKDDGVGLPEDLDISHPSSLGLTIVNAFTGQLGGTIALGRNGGSEISITFPAHKT